MESISQSQTQPSLPWLSATIAALTLVLYIPSSPPIAQHTLLRGGSCSRRWRAHLSAQRNPRRLDPCAPRSPDAPVQLLPNTVFYEAGHALDDGERISVPNATLAALVRRNHSTFPIAFGGFVQFIVQDLDGPATAALKDLDGPAGAALQKLDGRASAGQKRDSAAAVPSRGPGRKLIGAQEAAKLATTEPNFPPPLFGRLTAVSDPRKDGGPAGY
ncbi:unnamed protein product [Closterium sp. NIES-53]